VRHLDLDRVESAIHWTVWACVLSAFTAVLATGFGFAFYALAFPTGDATVLLRVLGAFLFSVIGLAVVGALIPMWRDLLRSKS
jgi:hypothetical protein